MGIFDDNSATDTTSPGLLSTLSPADKIGLLGSALMGWSAALGKASMPSRLPVPTGAILGQAGAGWNEGMQSYINQREGLTRASLLDMQARQLQQQFGVTSTVMKSPIVQAALKGLLPAMLGGAASPGLPTTGASVPSAPLAGDQAAAAGNDADSPAALVKRYESEGLASKLGISPYVIGTGGADLSKAALNENGFPIWEGHNGSHAAGAYQFQPGTWAQYAPALGIKDFSPASQDAIFRAAYLDQGYAPWAPYNPRIAAAIKGGAGNVQVANNGPLPAGLLSPGNSGGAMPARLGLNGTGPNAQLVDLNTGKPYTPGTAPSAIPVPSVTSIPGGANGIVPAGAAAAPADGPLAQAAPQATPMASGLPAPSAAPPALGLDPRSLAVLDSVMNFTPYKDLFKPLLNYYYNSPEYKGQLAGAETGAKNAADLPYAGPLASAKALAENRAKWAGPIEARQGMSILRENPATGNLDVAFQNPRLPEGSMLAPGAGPNGQPGAQEVPNVTNAITSAARAQALGTAQGNTTKEQNEVLKEEYQKNVVEPFNHAQSALQPLTALQNAMANFNTGPTAQTKVELTRAWQDVQRAAGISPDTELGKWIASGEIINKEGTQLGFELARTLGSREANMIVQQAIKSNPNIANSPQGNATLINMIKQGLQRDIDKRSFVDDWFNKNLTFSGATDAFNKTHPVESYVTRVLPFHPANPAEVSSYPPGTRYMRPGDATHVYTVPGGG